MSPEEIQREKDEAREHVQQILGEVRRDAPRSLMWLLPQWAQHWVARHRTRPFSWQELRGCRVPG